MARRRHTSPRDVISGQITGAIIAWVDLRNYSTTAGDIYAQRLNGNGVPQWAAKGVAVSTAQTYQLSARLVTDGSGGAIIAWTDFRNGEMNGDIFAQRLSGAGVPQWTVDGVAVCVAPNGQVSPRLVADGLGGAIIVWQDARNAVTTGSDIFASDFRWRNVRNAIVLYIELASKYAPTAMDVLLLPCSELRKLG